MRLYRDAYASHDAYAFDLRCRLPWHEVVIDGLDAQRCARGQIAQKEPEYWDTIGGREHDGKVDFNTKQVLIALSGPENL